MIIRVKPSRRVTHSGWRLSPALRWLCLTAARAGRSIAGGQLHSNLWAEPRPGGRRAWPAAAGLSASAGLAASLSPGSPDSEPESPRLRPWPFARAAALQRGPLGKVKYKRLLNARGCAGVSLAFACAGLDMNIFFVPCFFKIYGELIFHLN